MKKQKFLLLFFVLAFIVSCSLLVSNTALTVRALSNFVLSEKFETNLNKGDTISIPSGRFGSIDAKAYVYAPDGVVYTSSSVYLNVDGEYTVRYVATEGEKTYIHNEKFVVANPQYYFSGSNSSATYVENHELTKRDGLLIDLAKGETFNYNRIVNLYDSSRAKPAIKFALITSTLGRHDVNKIIVTFTDAYNHNNKVQVAFALRTGPDTYWNYCLARANDQSWKGFDNTGSGRLWVNAYGCGYNYYFYDSYVQSDSLIYPSTYDIFKNQYLGAWVNPETNEIHQSSWHYGDKAAWGSPIVDLDDNSYQDKVFEGFTTGEVLVSIHCEGYVSSSAKILCLSVNGENVFANSSTVDQKPEIALDTLGYSEDNLPNGVKGGTYKVFDAVAKDRNSGGYLDVEKRVFYEYKRNAGEYDSIRNNNYTKEISVVNGEFKTAQVGKYAICYRIKYSGKVVEKVVIINVEDTATPINDLVLKNGYTVNAQAGNRIYLADIEDPTGGVGDIEIEYAITKDGKDYEVLNNPAIGKYLIPKEQGVYTVTIRAKDFIGNVNDVSYTLNVSAQTTAGFQNDPVVNKYYFANTNYVIPEFYGILANGQKELAHLSIKDGNGTRECAFNQNVTFTPDANGNVTFIYAFGDNVREYVAPVISVKERNEIKTAKYFVGTNLSSVDKSNGVELSFKGDGKVDFANTLPAEAFSVDFTLNGMGSTWGALTIYLTDSIDSSISVAVTLKKGSSGLDLYINNQLKQTNFAKAGTINSYLSFNMAENSISLGGNNVKIANTIYGEKFSGFESANVYMSFEYAQISGTASMVVKSICNQDLGSTVVRDARTPYIALDGDYGNLGKIQGLQMTILPVVVSDVLSPYVSVTVTVECNYASVYSLDGTELVGVDCQNGKSYDIKLDNHGQYTIVYKAIDWANRSYELSFMVTSLDLTAPVILVNGDVPTKATVNNAIVLPKFTATDDYSKKVDIVKTIILPSGGTVYVKGNSYIPTVTGKHTLYILAIDESGNCAEVRYTIDVK